MGKWPVALGTGTEVDKVIEAYPLRKDLGKMPPPSPLSAQNRETPARWSCRPLIRSWAGSPWRIKQHI